MPLAYNERPSSKGRSSANVKVRARQKRMLIDSIMLLKSS
jgi:hypothetical protein